jgi:hypothetical protein
MNFKRTLEDSGASLEQICAAIQDWEAGIQTKGIHTPSTDNFYLRARDHTILSVQPLPADLTSDSLVVNPSVMITINERGAQLTWAEACEVMLALKKLLSVQMFG